MERKKKEEKKAARGGGPEACERADMGREPRAGSWPPVRRGPVCRGPPGPESRHSDRVLSAVCVQAALWAGGSRPAPQETRGPHTAHTSQGVSTRGAQGRAVPSRSTSCDADKNRDRTRQRLSVEGCVSPHAPVPSHGAP